MLTLSDETVHKERGDRVERAATTATSLDAEQDSGTINRTQSTTIPNEPIPQGTSLGGSPRRQDTILGDRPAQNRLEKKRKSRTLQLKRGLFKVKIESSSEKSLGDQEDASNLGRNDEDKGISFVQDAEIQGRYGHDTKINTASTSIITAIINITATEPVTTISAPITTVGVSVNTAEPNTPTPTTTTVIEDEDLTIAQTFMKMRSEKSKKGKERESKENSNETATRTTRGVIIREASETTTRPTIPPQQKLDLKDKELAKRLQAEEEGELSIEERSNLFVELINQRKKHFARLRSEEKRRKPPTGKHGCSFVPMDKEVVEGSETRSGRSSKRAGEELESDKSKKQMLDEKVEAEEGNDQKEAQMKMYMKIVSDDENINKEDLETLWKLVKAKYGNTRPEEAYERVLWGDLKSTFCEVLKSAYLYVGREKGRVVGIKRLLSAVEVTAASYEFTTAGYGFYCW
nr:hypothetical protein [Tanacetum cinerariifolium]